MVRGLLGQRDGGNTSRWTVGWPSRSTQRTVMSAWMRRYTRPETSTPGMAAVRSQHGPALWLGGAIGVFNYRLCQSLWVVHKGRPDDTKKRKHIPSPLLQIQSPKSQLSQIKQATYCARVSDQPRKGADSHHDMCACRESFAYSTREKELL